MSRIERLKEYANPNAGWHGCSRDEQYLDRWSERASRNSDSADHRASNGPMKLPNTGKRLNLRDTASRPYRSHKIDSVMVEAKSDKNFVGSSHYMPNVRRTTT